MPPAPPTFSITIDWPRISAIRAAMMRAATSIELPAVNETILVIGLFGQSCACAGDSSASAAPSAAQRGLTMFFLLEGLLRYSAVTPALLIGTAHFSISASTN